MRAIIIQAEENVRLLKASVEAKWINCIPSANVFDNEY
jgi:hypothetical protein